MSKRLVHCRCASLWPYSVAEISMHMFMGAALQMHPGKAFATNVYVPANQDERPAATALDARRELSAAF